MPHNASVSDQGTLAKALAWTPGDNRTTHGLTQQQEQQPGEG